MVIDAAVLDLSVIPKQENAEKFAPDPTVILEHENAEKFVPYPSVIP